MRSVQELFGKSSWYLTGYLITGIAGFISFPVWTRLLSIAEYGWLNLINAGLYFVVAMSKCGMQKSCTRFFAEFHAGKRRDSTDVFYTTLLAGVFAISTLVALAVIAALHFARAGWEIGPDIYFVLELAAVLGLFQTLSVMLIAFLTVEQKARDVTVWNVVQRYASFAVGLICATSVMKGVAGAILGALLVEMVIVVALTVNLIREKKLSLKGFSPTFFRECFAFGAPLGMAELSNVFLNVGDRYLIGLFLGTGAVGLYSAAYNMTSSAAALLAMPLTFALPPMFMETWQKQGAAATRSFLSSTMGLYLMIGTPCIAALTFYGERLMTLFASSRYTAGASLLPYVALPIILYGGNTIYSAGLFITKRSFATMYIALAAAAVNIGMNLVLIPRIGITGAGISTLVAYAVTIGLMLRGAPATLRLRIDVWSVSKYCLAAAGMVLWLRMSGWDSAGGVIATIAIGAALYWALLFIIDKSIREFALGLIKSMQTSLRLQAEKHTS
jgi:O-antigen/teichoic acid export membrane protein